MPAAALADRSLHFVGIGGAGMSGLAVVAAALGARVTGSDQVASSASGRLAGHGIEVSIGHAAEHVPAGAELVVSTAIPEHNPELAGARASGATVHHRSELLGELSELKRSIAVSGTHGKTTTAAMIAHVLMRCGREPAYLIGAELRPAGRNAAWGEGEWIVLEADESDRSLLALDREVVVVTNAELDHHDTYRALSDLEAVFAEFAAPARVAITGPGVTLAGGLSYGIEAGELRARALELLPLGSRFEVEGVPVELGVPGAHNALNALAALAACREAGVEPAEAAPALASFAGTGRRFEERGRSVSGARIFDDYAHHPTEVRATLQAARTLDPVRLIACFQPHLFSRTRELARQFGQALALADLVVVLDVYPARERAQDHPGVSGLTVARTVADAAAGRPVWWVPDIGDAAAALAAELGEGDVLLSLGAGDVDRLAAALAGDEPAGIGS